ncbi:T-lymphocyte surface antigen Ly-9-like isoform X2 [Hemitrygon akajei]|uniref:T-lymphocyte surface antigen Ly-9-like isoform X2 n=1 Tax=Hemitrygon akajei TaxID=2704970 RepID=UPI003BF9F4AB
MWKCLKRVLCLNSAFVFAIFLARTGASPAIVNGALGHSVSLFPSIPVRQDVDEVVWIKSSPRTKIARYSEGSIKYFNTIYNNRITLHSGNFGLEIHDLRKEDADEYEVIVTAGDSGDERRERIQLKVYARTGASPAIVNGALGHSVSLFPSIPVRQDMDEVVWIKSSPRTKIARYSEGWIKYFNTNHSNRITLHSGNFSLEIHDLRKEDADEYEVIVTAGDSGDERRERIQLKVYGLVSGANITLQTTVICNFTLTCTVTSGDHTSFMWWRNGEALVNDNRQHIRVLGNTLEVHHTAEVEDIVYKCEARNPISNEMAEIRLRDICKLDTCARTGASPAIVNGALGHSVSLFPSIPVRQDVYEVVWKRSYPSTKIARYLEGSIKYFNSNYNKRITLHSGNFSLEIHDLRKEDADEYEVIVTAGDSGNERNAQADYTLN